MMWLIGVVLFALAILVSVALHECGHMWVARATGMKVRRYFVGFGPTLWSTRRPNKLGSTEYGVKAIPLGGFCDIAGMTSIDEIAPEDRPYAMYKQKTWKRAAVLFAGPGMNFIVGLAILYGIALYWGLPNLNPQPAAYVSQTTCVAPAISKTEFAPCEGEGPAAAAGIKQGDIIVKVGDTEVRTADEMVKAVRAASGPTPFVVKRKEGDTTREFTTVVNVQQTQRYVSETAEAPSPIGAIGVSAAEYGPPEYMQYNPITAIPGTISFTGDLAVELGKSLAKIPTKVGALVHSIGGGERDPETPISVVGASIIGGDAFERGLFMAFWFFLAQLNFVLGAVNLVPLLPFDGGHIAVAFYEKIRNTLRRARGMAAGAPVNYMKLMPATWIILVVVVGYMALTVTADFVNPIHPFE
ncbi:zinc metalloprotease [Mycolicibacterium agri]|uniref:Zinc metalloprotease Rip1 n=1 Tax=Mycolicibacterium agri TaxID=36811 RepID=A0A2A7MRD1_MYCAG|nr:M50 family metallopeptidase [Mycolicibacterium agri]PEG34266.1 zinc metalloprotease [Mycolicibacterium agri]GFG49723.1 zinc metalloprotease Rip1 [Mycolicibacterium agri]